MGSRAQMSTDEYALYRKYLESNATNKPGRFGLKESICNMVFHYLGRGKFKRSSRFVLTNASGILATIFVHKLRMDISNQTVFLDTAAIMIHSGNGTEYQNVMYNAAQSSYCVVKIDENEAPFWKHLLPLFAERCHQWKHKSDCEYIAKGKIPLSTEQHERSMCSCGLGGFPKDYLKNERYFYKLRKHAVRVAIPVVCSSPIGDDDVAALPASSAMGPGTQSTPFNQTHGLVQLTKLAEKKSKCFHCGTSQAKNGKALLKCSRCKFSQYCSSECQKADWKEHKRICGQLKVLNSDG